jgi:DNA-binding transcriptional ArsR family regulator
MHAGVCRQSPPPAILREGRSRPGSRLDRHAVPPAGIRRGVCSPRFGPAEQPRRCGASDSRAFECRVLRTVLTFHVDADRLTRSRFALSRLAELTNGLEVLTHPGRAPHARPWVDRVRSRLDPAGLVLLFALVDHGSWYVPDFLVPIPDGYEPGLDHELAAVAATPPELVRFQLRMAFRLGPPPPAALRRSRAGHGHDPRWPLPVAIADALSIDGETALTARVAEPRRCWSAAMADSWEAMRRVLDENVRQQSAQAGRVGFAEIVGSLHPQLDWNGSQVTLQLPYDVQVDATPGIVLTPSVFLRRPAVWLGLPGQVMVGFPARGRGNVWSLSEPVGKPSNVLGLRRSMILADLDVPRSTTDLATRHRLSAATVSYHLSRLRQAGLVTRRQDGHSVLYERTGRAVDLLMALDRSAQ